MIYMFISLSLKIMCSCFSIVLCFDLVESFTAFRCFDIELQMIETLNLKSGDICKIFNFLTVSNMLICVAVDQIMSCKTKRNVLGQ